MRKKEEKNTWLFTGPFLCLFCVITISSAGFYMTMPTLPKYAVDCGMPLTRVGFLTGIFSVAAMVARPVSGMLADCMNKKKLMLVSLLLMVFCSAGYSVSHGYFSLLVWRILHGCCFACSSTAQLSIAVELVPECRRGEGLGYMGMAQVFAMSFAPSLGLRISESVGYERMFGICAAIVLSAAVLLLFLPVRASAVRPGMRKLEVGNLFEINFLLLALMGSLFSASNGIVSSYLTMLADERGIADVGLFFTISAAAVLISKPFSGRLMDRRGVWAVIIPCFVMGALSMFLVSGAGVLSVLLLAAVCKGIAQSAGQSALQAECANRSDALHTGVAMSTCYLGNDFGQGLGNVLGGALSSAVGYGRMFFLTGFLVSSGLLMAALQKRIDRNKKNLA